jgi:hypothetical protein
MNLLALALGGSLHARLWLADRRGLLLRCGLGRALLAAVVVVLLSDRLGPCGVLGLGGEARGSQILQVLIAVLKRSEGLPVVAVLAVNLARPQLQLLPAVNRHNLIAVRTDEAAG